MVSKRSIPARYSYHRPILSDVHPFEVPPTFSNGGFFDFVTRYDVRLEQSGRKTLVVWECSNDRLDQVIQLLFKTCRKHPVASPPSGNDRNFIENPTQSNFGLPPLEWSSAFLNIAEDHSSGGRPHSLSQPLALLLKSFEFPELVGSHTALPPMLETDRVEVGSLRACRLPLDGSRSRLSGRLDAARI